MENKFDSFIANIRNVTCASDLCDLICTLGLFLDNRGLYGRYTDSQVSQGGMWQDPMEFATFLWDSRTDFTGMESFLEIGTFTGYTFFVFKYFLRAFVNPGIRTQTMDVTSQHIDPEISPYISDNFVQGTSFDVTDQFDMVFIDGCHEAPWPLNDLNNLSPAAKIVIMHDVNDKYCPYVGHVFQNEIDETIWTKKMYACSDVGNIFGFGLCVRRM